MRMNSAWSRHCGERWLTTAPQSTMLPLADSRAPRLLTWAEQIKLLPLLPGHLASMALLALQ